MKKVLAHWDGRSEAFISHDAFSAAAPPSKVEFALGPPVLRPSEPGPEGEAPAG